MKKYPAKIFPIFHFYFILFCYYLLVELRVSTKFISLNKYSGGLALKFLFPRIPSLWCTSNCDFSTKFDKMLMGYSRAQREMTREINLEPKIL
jgi:hypothetical protein